MTTDKKSSMWWAELLLDEARQLDWLVKQYHGEVMAGERIRTIFGKFNLSDRDAKVVEGVAREEDLHAKWIGELLQSRGVEPSRLSEHKERYWAAQPVDNLRSPEEAAAVGHLAEVMRLSRIKAIVNNPDSPFDIAKVMKKILRQELGHAAKFKRLSNSRAIDDARGGHDAGLNALGLAS
tara:strand:+ start:13535 stop:14074 length:540 start_codon:yes stop_codon:yes gene_type:complete